MGVSPEDGGRGEPWDGGSKEGALEVGGGGVGEQGGEPRMGGEGRRDTYPPTVTLEAGRAFPWERLGMVPFGIPEPSSQLALSNVTATGAAENQLEIILPGRGLSLSCSGGP